MLLLLLGTATVFFKVDNTKLLEFEENHGLKIIAEKMAFGSKKSPACLFQEETTISYLEGKFKPSEYDTIYLYHSRKAGRTTLRGFMQKVAAEYNLELEVDEGVSCRAPGNPRTFYITSLREPLSRSISHYRYSFAWDCHKLINPKTSATNLLEFDVILQTELLKSEEYISRVEAFFGVSFVGQKDAYCARQSREANHKVNLTISKSDVNLLRKKNKWDLELYEFITSCDSN